AVFDGSDIDLAAIRADPQAMRVSASADRLDDLAHRQIHHRYGVVPGISNKSTSMAVGHHVSRMISNWYRHDGAGCEIIRIEHDQQTFAFGRPMTRILAAVAVRGSDWVAYREEAGAIRSNLNVVR